MTERHCYIVELSSTGSVVDTSAVAQALDVLNVVDIVTLDQSGEMTGVRHTIQLPDGTLAVVDNLSQCQYQLYTVSF